MKALAIVAAALTILSAAATVFFFGCAVIIGDWSLAGLGLIALFTTPCLLAFTLIATLIAFLRAFDE